MREVLTVIPFTPITINPNSTSLPLLPSQYNLTDYIPVSTLSLGISGRVRSMGKETKDGKRRWRKAEGETPEGAVSSVSGVSGSGNPTDRSTRGLPVLPHPPESTQTHVHWVDDAIRPSHPCRPLLCLPSGEQSFVDRILPFAGWGVPWWLSGEEFCLPVQETWAHSLGQKYPLEEEMASHFSVLAWEIPRTEEPGRIQSIGSRRVREDSANKQQQEIPQL